LGRVVKELRALPIPERRSLAENLSRIRRKLTNGEDDVRSQAGYLGEVALAVVGAVVLALGSRHPSNLLVIVCSVIWSITLQPLIKAVVGHLLGIRYECISLGDRAGVQDALGRVLGTAALRATAVAAVRDDRLSAWRLATDVVRATPSLRIAIHLCWALFWTVVPINPAGFVAVLTGVCARLGSIQLRDSSGGAAALEMREAALEI
jgi:hypothetical protein